MYENEEGDENETVESILDATQYDVITTNNLTQNENVNESVGEIATDVIETVEAESSKSNDVNILNQLAMIIEMMNNKFDKQNKNLNEFKTEIKSENIKMMCVMNASNIELKTEIKAEINEINNRFNKQDEKLGDINNKFVNIRSEIKMSNLSMNNQFESISESFNGVSEKFVEINNN